MVPAPTTVSDRIARLLRALSQFEPNGATTSEIARASGVSRPTAYRLLVGLVGPGLVDRSQDSGRWALGPEVYLLGMAASPRYDVRSKAQRWVRKLAEATEESAFYSTRRGGETVCLIKEDGAFPIRSHVLYEGARFPLGVVSAGMAVLAFLHDQEIAAYLADEDLTDRYGDQHSTARILSRVRETRERGYAVNPGLLVEGSWGIAAVVFGQGEVPIGALSVTGVEHRFASGRREELGRIILRAAHGLSQSLQQAADP